MAVSEEKISIIVPVYKVEEYLDECVESIVSQTYKNLEIILVDDGSPDRSPEICDNWAKKDKRVKVIHQQNAGQSEARNSGIKVATGDYITFVDSDDWIDEQMYEKLFAKLKEESADVAMCRIINEYPNVSKKYFEKNLTQINEKNIYELYINSNMMQTEKEFVCDGLFGSVCRTLFKKSVIKNIWFLKDAYCEDLLYNILCLKNIKKVAVVDEYFYHYRMRPISSIHTLNKDNFYKKLNFIKAFLPQIENKVSREAFCAYKFSFYCIMLVTLSKDADKKAYKLVVNDELLKTFHNKFNYKCLMKQTTGKIKKISYFLVYHKQYWLFNFVYRRK